VTDVDKLDDSYHEVEVPGFPIQWSRDLRPASGEVPWLWEGYLAPYHVTLLTSQWKSGKTTLVSVLLARRAAGGTFADRALKPGRTAVVCEETHDLWEQRRRTLDFGDGVAFLFQPFSQRKPSYDDWQRLLETVGRLNHTDGVDLLVIDPLASFLPAFSENASDLMLTALSALDRVLQSGMAVLLLHHPKKGPTLAGQAARGPGTLSSFVDISVEIRPYHSLNDPDRRRVLQAWSRFPKTPRQLVMEWTADGTDYRGRGAVEDEEYREHWEQLAAFFATAPEKLTRRELRALLPTGRSAPSDTTLWRWLDRAIAAQLLRRDGTGHRNAPFRYWTPAREAEWMNDPHMRWTLQQEADHAELMEALSRQPEPVTEKTKRARDRRR
jgi:hypothetical protein